MTFDEWWDGLRVGIEISSTDRGYFLTQEADWVSKDDMRSIFALIEKALKPKDSNG